MEAKQEGKKGSQLFVLYIAPAMAKAKATQVGIRGDLLVT
jgi:hypothetical protein